MYGNLQGNTLDLIEMYPTILYYLLYTTKHHIKVIDSVKIKTVYHFIYPEKCLNYSCLNTNYLCFLVKTKYQKKCSFVKYFEIM